MKRLECIIFNVEHGFCAFIKSPNDYGLLIDCGSREYFSPVKWVRSHYNLTYGNVRYFKNRRIAQLIITHLHADHFDDVGSLTDAEAPKILQRDKETLRFINEKIEELSDTEQKDVLIRFRKFQESYSEDVEEHPNWGFDYFKYRQLPYKVAESLSKSRDKIINNRSYLVGIQYAEKKILIPGDIEVEGWKKAFDQNGLKEILKDTTFFVCSHHGHKTGFTSEILEYTGIPQLYIVSAKTGDEHIDSCYSKQEFSRGCLVDGDIDRSRMVSTRHRKSSIKITITETGKTSVCLVDTPDNLNENQKKILGRRKKQILKNWGMR